ncbi:MAG: hypothetical protein GY816_09670 [Cytophagales bacterium]|nr:hypothetical protein [Cytophagales bacterium]
MKLFDYIFYRWLELYSKHDDHPALYASGMVSAYQLLTLVDLVFISSIFFDFEIENAYFIYPFIAISFLINYIRYERNFDISKLKDRWENESEASKKINWRILVTYLIIAITIPIIYGFTTN